MHYLELKRLTGASCLVGTMYEKMPSWLRASQSDSQAFEGLITILGDDVSAVVRAVTGSVENVPRTVAGMVRLNLIAHVRTRLALRDAPDFDVNGPVPDFNQDGPAEVSPGMPDDFLLGPGLDDRTIAAAARIIWLARELSAYAATHIKRCKFVAPTHFIPESLPSYLRCEIAAIEAQFPPKKSKKRRRTLAELNDAYRFLVGPREVRSSAAS
jgi:hypothetical protein